ncbi:MAG: MoaD/ThiS family protein [Sulfolobales archaeon]
MLKIKIRLYAVLRDLYGSSEDLIEVEGDRISVRDLLSRISSKNTSLKEFMRSRGEGIIVLVNGLYAPMDQFVREGDVVDILPPASGGVF